MGCCRGRGLGGRICDLRQRFSAVSQEQESWFLYASTKPARWAGASPVTGLKTDPQSAVPPRGCWSWGCGVSLVAKELGRKPGARLVSGTRADGRCGVEIGPLGPGVLLRMGSILCPQRGGGPGAVGTHTTRAQRWGGGEPGAAAGTVGACVPGADPAQLWRRPSRVWVLRTFAFPH